MTPEAGVLDPPSTAEGDVTLVAQPGEQGTAIQESEAPPPPSAEDIAAAVAAHEELRANVGDAGAEATISSLVGIVDALPAMARPEEWPGDEEEVYQPAPEIQAIATLLLKGCPKLRVSLSPKHLVSLWRNQAKWIRRGSTVRSDTKALDTRTQFLTKGKRAVIEINFHHWKALNPLQKVFTVYHELREAIDAHADFEGYFDELELFGSRVFRDMAQLAATIQESAELELPHQLGIFDQVEEG